MAVRRSTPSQKKLTVRGCCFFAQPFRNWFLFLCPLMSMLTLCLQLCGLKGIKLLMLSFYFFSSINSKVIMFDDQKVSFLGEKIYIINVLSPTWSRSCKHFVAKFFQRGRKRQRVRTIMRDRQRKRETEIDRQRERKKV